MDDTRKGIAILSEDPWEATGSGAVLRVRDAISGMRRSLPIDVFVPRLVARPRWRRALAAAWLIPEDIARTDAKATARRTNSTIGHDYAFSYVAGPSLLATARHMLPDTPTVLDMFDVPSHLHRLHLRHTPSPRAMQRLRGTLDVRAWTRFERGLGAAKLTVVTASDEDADRLGCQAVVIPNGYAAPLSGRSASRDRATVLFVGHLAYPPNLDAARFLVNEVLPLIRTKRPDAGLVIVGRQADRWIQPSPGVEVHADVESTVPFLSRATVVAAPVRYGTGTRVKLLEAFAHHVPVVAHPIAAEGLGAEDGVHLVLATSAREVADAVLAVFADRATGSGASATRADAAFELLARRFESSVVQRSWSDLAASLARTK